MTTLQYVSDALKLIGIIAETETPSPEQGADGVRMLNDMMMFYLGLGYNNGYNPQANTADSFTPPPEDREGLKALLAVRLAPQYGIEIPQAVALMSIETDTRWRRKAALNQLVSSSPAMPLGEGSGVFFDITTGR